jgi:hypothetical protein
LCCDNCLGSCTCSDMTPYQRAFLFTLIVLWIGVAFYSIHNFYTSS